MSAPEPAGADLARIALAAARAAARGRPVPQPARTKRRTSIRRSDGRDPLPLGKALDALVTERGWETPAAGGTVLDQWPQIAPELAGKVIAEAFDAETGCLSLRPSTDSYGAQLRLFQRQIIVRIAEKTGSSVVRSLRVLPPQSPAGRRTEAGGAVGDGPVGPPGTPGGPALRTRTDASPGLIAAQQALAALQDRVPRAAAPAAAGRYVPVLREPEEQFTDAVAAAEETAARGQRAEDPLLRARARARAEKAGRVSAVPRVFGQTA